MKKILSLAAQALVVSSAGLTTVACSNSLNSAEDGKSKPPDPIVQNIKYYQVLIKETENYILDCDEMLVEIKDNRDGYDDEVDYQSALDEVKAQRFAYQAEICDYQYQILLLEFNEKFTAEQVLEGIVIFSTRVSSLEQELKLKEKYPDYYTEKELEIIRNDIQVAKLILEIFLALKED
ncbi:hypothetical protein [Spiroplasma platyhelix]|uniref:Lipoprotein n=1 Tax=Spiroplasma platyhelix PALS-1 TaxID=1276218 RepID=A0A846TX65_9MOLU|nr:hypothetical protein [Spiroplasma platyhelix]MBE4704422.1 hypothetical protein [Spiroplasma platyhelix PALS-1]NKE38792.1 hypothetical protein [Spiroplasma platyhelix PALS-1]UJB29004.1 hypothetical protein SPLAT_v1c02400 [Spiroplasma platyhelix PALS-1]